ncbi:RodZ domain-containing protein [Jeongeupia sp. USM3]|uniref:RodZ domain-containing protein n=1 Tax=Jeongeupia sp. USM3 TaxID=1906741 RepID=UPI00089DE75C|nr:RodZ domain-containing protein [Jeongeupia sp. USM3]AOX99579.1 hypothetical protein BJP62_03380 [Jeongeupia sp. USM3]
MTDEPIQTPPESPPAQRIGAQLRAQREALNLSIDDVVTQLKLTRGQVAAIEEDRFGDLPGNTFARGFVRNYARLLQLDPEPLVAQLAEALPVEREQASLPHLAEEATFSIGGGGRGRPLQLTLTVIAGLIIGAGGVFWYLQQPAAPELNVSTTTLVLPEASAPADTVLPLSIASEMASEVASAPVAAPAAVPVTPAPAPASEVASAPVANSGEIRLVAEQDSWIQVVDAGGNKLISEVLKAGDERSLGGVAPYRIKIGNSPKTQLYLRGQRVDLAQYSRSDVATLELK